MTDQLTRDPSLDDAQNQPTTAVPLVDPPHAQPPVVRQSKPSAKHPFLWLWITGSAVLVLAVAALVLLIAPGTTIAGVPVGGLPANIAANVVTQRLADASVSVNGTRMTGRELGLQVDAAALANSAHAERPLWNIGAWFGKPIEAPVTLQAGKVDKALRAALPSLYTAPKDATVTFSNGTYVVKPAVSGTRVDTAALAADLEKAFTSDSDRAAVRTTSAPALAPVSTTTANATATKLNGMLGTIGFYVGSERTVPVAPDVAASWLTVTPDDATGSLTIAADQKKIQTAVDALPGQVNRQPVNAQNIVNSAGAVLRTDTAGQNGRALGDTKGIAHSFATQLADGKAEYNLPVTETPFQTTNVLRSIDVNLETQTVSMIQNGAVVDSWAISSGLPSLPTPTGHFTVRDHIRVQTMSSEQYGYSVPNVQWVMYFDYNGDAFHGVYWHDNFGHPMSHGCVGMPISRAEQLYNWTPDGTEVFIH